MASVRVRDARPEKLGPSALGPSTPQGRAAAPGHAAPQRHRPRIAAGGPAGQQTIRRQNLGLVMREVMDGGPRSRASIAEAVGLTKSTVSSLVSELLARGLLSERGFAPGGGVGRPGRLVALSDRTVGVGLEINVDYLAVCVLDLSGGVRYERFARHENRGAPVDRVFDAVGELGRDALAAVEAEGLVPVGAAIAVPGLVDVERGVMLNAPNLGWTDTWLQPEIARRLGRPHLYLTAQNEANLAGLGELWQGNGRDWGDFVHVSGEVGVGGALVLDADLIRFGTGLAGELGHISIDPNGPECACGSRGCLERLVGQEALLAAAQLRADVGTTIGLPNGGVQLLVERASQSDPTTLQALADAGRIRAGVRDGDEPVRAGHDRARRDLRAAVPVARRTAPGRARAPLIRRPLFGDHDRALRTWTSRGCARRRLTVAARGLR